MDATATPQATREKAGRREWLGLAVLTLPCMLYSMDVTVLNLAVPRIVTAFAPSRVELLWIIDIYGFVLAGALIPMGTLGERIGRRRLLLCGAGAFGVVSTMAAFSTSARMLIGMRALLGLAGAALGPSTLSLIHTMFRNDRERAVAMGVWGASFSAGGAVGPVFGGLLLERFWWGSVFLLALPLTMPLLATGRALLPEVKAAAPGRADIAGAALWLAAVLAAVYGIKELARGGSGWIAAVPAAAVLGAAFVRRQRTAAAPLIDLRMFRRRVFRVSLAGHVLGIGVVWGMYVLIAQHLELGLGWSPLRAGTCLLAPSAGFTIGSLLLPAFTRRFHPFLVVAGGLLLGAAGLLVLAQSTGLVGFVIGSLGYSLGFAPVAPLCSTVTVESVGAEGAGIAAAIAETGSELGGALGVALLGSLATAVDRSCLAGHAFSVAAAAGAAVAVATAVLLVAPRSREAGCPAPSGREASPLATV